MKKFFMLFAISTSSFLSAQEGCEESTATTEHVATTEVATTSDVAPNGAEGDCNCGGAK